MKIENQIFGQTKEGKKARLFTLKSDDCIIKITNYGGIITSLQTPDKYGKLADITLGFDSLEKYQDDYYLKNNPYFGCLIGRYSNRIAQGKFLLNGKEYQLKMNDGENHLHGGISGFDKKLWNARTIHYENFVGVELEYTSPHMEEGYPGNLNVRVRYTLDKQNRLLIEYFASTDQTTFVNLTCHPYFNLTGSKTDILNHELLIYADNFTPSINLIPTGEISHVEGTPFDFRRLKKIGTEIDLLPEGYDQNFVLKKSKNELAKAAMLMESHSGRTVQVFTSLPGLQLYTGYHIPAFDHNGKTVFGKFAGLALEAQHFPDSPNHESFPSTVLHPQEKYEHQTIYKFGILPK